MLIILSESLREQDLREPLAARARDALLNLATAAYGGKHLITGSRRLFGELQQLAPLRPVHAGRFKEASALITEAQALRSKVSAYVMVEPIGSKPRIDLVHSAGATQTIFNVPLDYFGDAERTGRSWFVGEDPRDITIYITLGEAYATRFRGFPCALNKMDGHGGATANTFELLAKQDKAVLCIVDSDRSASTGALRGTAAAAVECHERMKAHGKIAALHVLPCRELENLLPADVVTDALPGDLKHPHRVNVLANQHLLGLVDFAELKHLVKLEQVSEHLARLKLHACAALFFSRNVHSSVEEVGALIWSFGLASRKGRT